MSDNEREKFEEIFPVPKNVEWNPEWCGLGRYEPVNSLLDRDSPESADIQNQRWIGWKTARAQPTETPAARWREYGEEDPCGEDTYNCERAKLCMGHLTDDELANEVFLYNHRAGHQSMGYLTAAKERIRWLSRKLEGEISEGDAENIGAPTQRDEWIDARAFTKWSENIIRELDPHGNGMVPEELAKEAMALPILAQQSSAQGDVEPVGQVVGVRDHDGAFTVGGFDYLPNCGDLVYTRPPRAGVPDGDTGLQEVTNKVCQHIPEEMILSLCMENGAAWVELVDRDGDSLSLPESSDKSLSEQIEDALHSGLEWSHSHES